MFIRSMLLLVQVVTTSPDGTLPASAEQCEYDKSVLSLGYDDFDKNTIKGWRKLSEKPGCEAKSAELLKKYRRKYEQFIPLLYWHEALVRAEIGETNDAIALMKSSKRKGTDSTGWNPYVDASIAFLRNDKSALLVAHRRLASWPKPNGWPVDAKWPQNLDVVDGLLACFGKSYKFAYGVNCRPASAVSVPK